MRGAGEPGGLVDRADPDPDADGGAARARHALGDHPQAAGQHRERDRRAVGTRVPGPGSAGHAQPSGDSDLCRIGVGRGRRGTGQRRRRRCTGTRLILPRASISAISTCSLSPTLTTSSTLAIRLPLPSLEMCTRPSRPGSSETNAPNAVVLTTVPRNRSPTLGSCGLAIALILSIAACTARPSAPETKMVPSSSMAISAPVASVIELIILPFGPITSPILSTGTLMVVIRGANWLISSGASIASFITSRMVSRASRAWVSAARRTSEGMPSSLVSSCSAVTN